MKVEVKGSSAIQRYEYNKDSKMLKIMFVNGKKEYEYPNVPEEIVHKWSAAESMGKYYNKEIRKFGLR